MTTPMGADTAADDVGGGGGGPTYPPEPYVLHAADGPLEPEQLRLIDAWWRAANYLSVGQIYLTRNPLLRKPLAVTDIKPRLLGHWGTTPALNLVYAHANREIVSRDLDAVYVMGPGHGGPGPNAAAWLEGTYTERWSHIPRDAEGMARFFRQFSFPGGVPSHCAPQTPGSFHEGGELGYSLLHAFGAAFDNPDLTVFCVIGDGEAETGPLAASWHAKTFLDPARDGAVLPILNLNQYKIANPTMLARMPRAQLRSLLAGYGYDAMFVEGDDPSLVHQAMAATMDAALDRIAAIQAEARSGSVVEDIVWPVIVLVTPKGWTGPALVDGLKVEGTYRAHQVPLANVRDNPSHLAALEGWLKAYRPAELFDEAGAPVEELKALPPQGDRRMSANPHANGGSVLRDLELPMIADHAVTVHEPGTELVEATKVLGGFLREVVRRNPDQFLVTAPDELASNRLQDILSVTGRRWGGEIGPDDDRLTRDGRVIEVLSEHLCQGLLEGYLLTGRHGVFTCYEAFIHIVDSMFNQHAKWLESSSAIPWRRPLASLNYLLSSHVWRQDHNGFSHQDPGFLDVVLNKKPDNVRVYLPPDANTLLSVYDHCLRSRQRVNVVVAGKQPALSYLTMEQAVLHCTRGLGIWEFASNSGEEIPDVILGCAGDVPTLETLAATSILREHLPALKIRVVNVVDVMRLMPRNENSHGLDEHEYDALFPAGVPVVFAFHGYPTNVHRLTYKRSNHDQFHVHGFKEEGTTTTPFDMVMLNDLSRFDLVTDVIDRVDGLAAQHGSFRQDMLDAKLAARAHTREHGDDDPAITNWRWPTS